MMMLNPWCCQPTYCRENSRADYENPARCKDCQRERLAALRAMQIVVPPALYERCKADPRYSDACERGDIVPNRKVS
jgi:hypothetical protein